MFYVLSSVQSNFETYINYHFDEWIC